MRLKQFISFMILLSLPLLVKAIPSEMPLLPEISPMIPAPPALAAKSYLLIDFLSDYVIAEQDIDQRVEPASLTKMMTVYVADQALRSHKIQLSDQVKISKEAWQAQGSRMFVEVNSLVPLDEIIKGIIIQSGNDASIAIAEHIAGSETAFAALMNFYAEKLGMINTHFMNSTGLPDPNHYSTARDMAILAKALIRDFPLTYKIYSQKEYTYKEIKQENRNRLLWNNELVDGIKTGHTDTAGYCLVASGREHDMRLIAVVMGTKSDGVRTDETNKLLNYGFQFFETRKLYPANITLKQTRVWMGAEKEANLGLMEDLFVTFGRGQYDRLKANINIEKIIEAPLTEGMPLGMITVELDDKTLLERPIVSLNNIERAGIVKRAWDSLHLNLKSLWEKVRF